jgi:membrane-associated phospholipid phosphatase
VGVSEQQQLDAFTSSRVGWTALGITLAATALTLLVDKAVFDVLHAPDVYDSDLGKLFRIMGFAGTWVALAAAVRLQQGADAAHRAVATRRAWLLFWSPMLAGALAEVLKIVARRERPAIHDGLYGFRPWDERTWSGAGLAFPSSHAAVAFGGAAMLARLFPRARWVGYALAAGCAATRVAARAHFVSDVVFAAGLGWLVSWALWRKWAPRAFALLLVAGIAFAPRGLEAQQAPASAAPCIQYNSCAYNLVPRGLGLAVVRGEQEDHVATLGFLWPGRLDGVFSGDADAERLGRSALRTRRVAATLTVGGLLTMAAGGAALALDAEEEVAIGLAAGGGAMLAISIPLQFRADGLLARAVWLYNRRFAR